MKKLTKAEITVGYLFIIKMFRYNIKDEKGAERKNEVCKKTNKKTKRLAG